MLHVLDAHRPWNLSNLFATSQANDHIFVWDDGEIEERMQREREAYEMLEFDLETDSEDEAESEEESGVESEPDEGAHAEATNGHDTSDTHKRKRHDVERPEKRTRLDGEQRLAYRALLARYYARGSWTGMSTAQMMYMLAVSLGRSDRDCLWYAILGLTAQYQANAIQNSTYDTYAAALASDVATMNAIGDADGPLDGVNSHGADDSSVRVVPEELRFVLYRHWSLESSMYHTSYVAAKLGIWRERGLSKLRGLLAKMGLSLANCRQTYEHMELDLRESLVSRMESIAPEYGLTDLTFRSFIRSFGFRSMPLSATDTVEGVAALLQAAHGVRIEMDDVAVVRTDPAYLRTASGSAGAGPASSSVSRKLWSLGDVGVQTAADAENSASAAWVQNFFEGYRALDLHRPASIALLQQSMHLAKALHQAIIAQGVSIILKQSIKTLLSFRLAILQDGPSLALFVQPDTLTRLGFWLIDALRDIVSEQQARRAEAKRARRRNKGQDDVDYTPTNLPFVLAALDAPRDMFVVVGIVGAPDFGDVSKNRFGLAFQEASTSTGARMRNDRFESSVLEVHRDDLMEFVEALHLNA